MLRTITALALATFLQVSVAAGEAVPRKPPGKAPRTHAGAKAVTKTPADPNALAAALGTYPAKVEYVSNDAPFVVFDVSPRKLDLRADSSGPKEASLVFVATDALSYVNVFTYTTSAQNETKELAGRTACGSKIPGHYTCAVPLRAAVVQLQGGDGFVGMRIETEGLDGDRSTIRVTLPVKTELPAAASPSGADKGKAPNYRHALTFIVDDVSDEINRRAVRR